MRTHIYVLMLVACSVFSLQAMLYSGPTRSAVVSALRMHTQQRFVSSTPTTQGRKIAAYYRYPDNKSPEQQELEAAKRALSLWEKYNPRHDKLDQRKDLERRIRDAEFALTKKK
jgi:hypothetical protein